MVSSLRLCSALWKAALGTALLALLCSCDNVDTRTAAGTPEAGAAGPRKSAAPAPQEAGSPVPTPAPSATTSNAAESDHPGWLAGLSQQEVRAFFLKLQENLASKDAHGLASMVRYPLNIYPKGSARAQQVVIEGPEEFVRMYSLIVYPQLEDAVATARETTLSGHAEGVMIGRGHIWFGKACENPQCTRYSVKILTINPAMPEEMYRSIKEKTRTPDAGGG